MWVMKAHDKTSQASSLLPAVPREDGSDPSLGVTATTPGAGWGRPGAHLSSSPRSLWFSLVATALVLCSLCSASRSVLSTFSSSSSSTLRFCKSPCLVGKRGQALSTPRLTLTPQAAHTPGGWNTPSQRRGIPLKPVLRGVVRPGSREAS